MDGWLLNLVRAGAIASGLMAGLFFAFSVAVMPALRQVRPRDGIVVMQGVNRAILNPLFLLVFVGAALLAAAIAVTTVWTWDDGGAGLRLAAGVVCLIGVVVLTAAYHIPRNDALDRLDADSTGSADRWATYLAEWVPWNHVRTLASTTSLVLLVIAAHN
jgi:uncharacterized membrane protein